MKEKNLFLSSYAALEACKNNPFIFVFAAAERAKQLSGGAPSFLKKSHSKKPACIALEEIYDAGSEMVHSILCSAHGSNYELNRQEKFDVEEDYSKSVTS